MFKKFFFYYILLNLFIFSILLKKNDIICNTASCSFNISNYSPESPIFPENKISKAILGQYRYIYLIFESVPKTCAKFSFKTIYVSNGKSINSNGDYYNLDLTDSLTYEQRIFDTINPEYIRIDFFNFVCDIKILVTLKFELDQFLYWTDKVLDNGNIKIFTEKEKAKEIDKRKETFNKIVKIAENIGKDVLGVTLRLTPLNYQFYNDQITMSGMFYEITISIYAGYEITYSKYFDDLKYVISKTLVEGGKYNTFEYETEGIDINIKKGPYSLIYNFYKQKLDNLFLGISKEIKNGEITVSTDLQSIRLDLTLYYDKNKSTYGEIQIDIKPKNNVVLDAILVYADDAVGEIKKNIKYELIENKGFIKITCIIFVIISIVMLTISPVGTGISAAIGGVIAFINNLQGLISYAPT